MANKLYISSRYLFFLLVLMLHLYSDQWKEIWQYHADSVTLPLILESYFNSALFEPIFSSQLFLFPEFALFGPIFFAFKKASTQILAMTTTIALVWLALTYAIAAATNRIQRNAMWGIYTITVLLLCASEIHPEINRYSFSTPFFFSTYYGGVILAGFAIIALILHPHAFRLNLFLIGTICALTSLSNPLFIIQVFIPLAFSIILCRSSVIHFRRTLFVIVLCSISGLALRSQFRNWIGKGTQHYLSGSSIKESLYYVHSVVQDAISHPSKWTKFIVFTWLAIIAISHINSRRKLLFNSSSSIVFFFSIFSAFFSPLVAILTGNPYTRYFLPVSIYLPLILFSTPQIWQKFQKPLGAVLVGSIIFFIVLQKHTPSPQFTHMENISCIQQILEKEHYSLAGGFWTSRPIAAYVNSKATRILQFDENIDPMPWMNNRAEYASVSLQGIIIDNEIPGLPQGGFIFDRNVSQLGKPSRSYQCKNIHVFYFEKGTSGYRRLNRLSNM